MKPAAILAKRDTPEHLFSLEFSEVGLDALSINDNDPHCIALIGQNDAVTYLTGLTANSVWKFLYPSERFPYRSSIHKGGMLSFCEQDAHRVAQKINEMGIEQAIVFRGKGKRHHAYEPLREPDYSEVI